MKTTRQNLQKDVMPAVLAASRVATSSTSLSGIYCPLVYCEKFATKRFHKFFQWFDTVRWVILTILTRPR